MRVPAYLSVSRHGVFYFRWPIPKALHPAKKATTIKVSLQVHDPKHALLMSRMLSYVAPAIMAREADKGMRYDDMRKILSEHFARLLTDYQSAVAKDGRLPSERIEELRRWSIPLADQIAQSPTSFIPSHVYDTANAFISQFNVPIEPDTDAHQAFVREYWTARRDLYQGMVAHDARMGTYAFASEARQSSPVQAVESIALRDVVEEFWKRGRLEKKWTSRTQAEKAEHIDFLYEVLGHDLQIASLGRKEARRVRETLSGYPVHRTKLKATRGKPLAEVLDLPGVKKIHPLTINKYMHTFNGLFIFAVREGFCVSSPFDGLTLDTSKVNDEVPRTSFSDDQLTGLLGALAEPSDDAPAYHRWGTLLAIHSGARLNEVAQLSLSDIVMVGDTWCLDINRSGPFKRLKNHQSKRIVPLHPRLMDLGFLTYVEQMRAIAGNDRLFPQLSYSTSDGYGRNLGRWVNETLLPRLGMKTKQLTFHSLRHTFVRKLIAADVSQAHIMAIVGHEQNTTTLKSYNTTGFPPAQLLAAIQSAL